MGEARGRRGLMAIKSFVVIAAIVIKCRNARHVGKGPRQGRRARPVDAWSGEMAEVPMTDMEVPLPLRTALKNGDILGSRELPMHMDDSVGNEKDFTIFSGGNRLSLPLILSFLLSQVRIGPMHHYVAGLTTRDWKTWHQNAGLEKAGKGIYGKPNGVLYM